MSKSWIPPSLLLLALVGCKASSKPADSTLPAQSSPQQAQVAPVTPPPQPKYGWKVFHAETFETHTLGAKAILIPKRSAKLHVDLQATSAVFGGVISKDFLDKVKRKHLVLRTQNFQKMPCSLMMVDKSGVTCTLDKDEQGAYFIRDARAEGTGLGGAFGFLHHSNKLAERAALPDKIHVTLSTWECIENCISFGAKVNELYGLKK